MIQRMGLEKNSVADTFLNDNLIGKESYNLKLKKQ